MQIKKLGWFWVMLTTMLLAYIAMPACAVEKQTSDGKVAVVNGAVISQVDFDGEMERINRQQASIGRPFNESQLIDVKKAVLETLINRELLYQESQNHSIKVEDKAVDEQFEIMKTRFPSEDEFKSALQKKKISEATLKSQIRKNMAIQQFIDKEYVQKVKVPQKEVKDFYVSQPDSFKEPEQVRASHILIKVDPGTDESKKAEARKKLKGIHNKLQKGENFEALAKEYSEGPSGAKGGDLGYFSRGQMVEPFDEVAFGLSPGRVSDIVETQFGYHLIKVVDKKPEGMMSYEEVKDKLQQYIKQQKVREQVNLSIENLKEKAKVERFQEDKS
jgi:peptidyl-prolyl cis-trans isomerase C